MYEAMSESHAHLQIIAASNCAEARKLGCVVNPDLQEVCSVTTPQGLCFCDENCYTRPGVCCTDGMSESNNLFTCHNGEGCKIRALLCMGITISIFCFFSY